jgi:hypothetical protein
VASSEQLKALIKSHTSRDDSHFYSVAMQVAAHEAKLGHGKLAGELRDLIDSARARVSQDSSGKLVPIAGALNNALMLRRGHQKKLVIPVKTGIHVCKSRCSWERVFVCGLRWIRRLHGNDGKMVLCVTSVMPISQ